MKAVQKLVMTMGTPRISKSGVERRRIPGWNTKRSFVLSNWHIWKLMCRPFKVLSASIMSIALESAALGLDRPLIPEV